MIDSYSQRYNKSISTTENDSMPCCCRYISSKISLRSLVKPVILILFLILVFYYHSELFAATREMLNVSNTEKTGLDFTIRYSAMGKMKVRQI